MIIIKKIKKWSRDGCNKKHKNKNSSDGDLYKETSLHQLYEVMYNDD